MMSGKNLEFDLYFSARALRQLKNLDTNSQKRIKEAVVKLKTFPPVVDVGKVKTRPGEFRLRVGNWRVFYRYRFKERQVEIITIRPRDKAYS